MLNTISNLLLSSKIYLLDKINKNLNSENIIFIKFLCFLVIIDYIFIQYQRFLIKSSKQEYDSDDEMFDNEFFDKKERYNKNISKKELLIEVNEKNVLIKKLKLELEESNSIIIKLKNNKDIYKINEHQEEEYEEEEDEEEEEYKEEEEDEEEDEEEEYEEEDEEDDVNDILENVLEEMINYERDNKKVIEFNDECKKEILDTFEFGEDKQSQERYLRQLCRIINKYN